MARGEKLHALGIQEANVVPCETQKARIRDHARNNGFAFTFFGEIQHCNKLGDHISVILFVAVHARAMHLPDYHDHEKHWPGRAVAAQIPRRGMTPLTLVCLYAHASDHIQRDKLIASLTSGLATANPKRDFIIIGDFNCLCTEGAVANALANNVCKYANAPFDPRDPPTRVGEALRAASCLASGGGGAAHTARSAAVRADQSSCGRPM